MTALEQLRILRQQEESIKNRINEILPQAVIEAQAFTQNGKFEFLGHNYVLDHVEYDRIKCLD